MTRYICPTQHVLSMHIYPHSVQAPANMYPPAFKFHKASLTKHLFAGHISFFQQVPRVACFLSATSVPGEQKTNQEMDRSKPPILTWQSLKFPLSLSDFSVCHNYPKLLISLLRFLFFSFISFPFTGLVSLLVFSFFLCCLTCLVLRAGSECSGAGGRLLLISWLGRVICGSDMMSTFSCMYDLVVWEIWTLLTWVKWQQFRFCLKGTERRRGEKLVDGRKWRWRVKRS